MNRQHAFFIIISTAISILTLLFFLKRPIVALIVPPQATSKIIVSSPRTLINFYVYAQNLSVNGIKDPPCNQTRNIYVCAGYCPWPNTHNNEFVTCSFLPRILHHAFVKYGVYCTPEPDYCPTYDAWLKDSLPPTEKHIKRIPDYFLSNFTLDYSIPIRYGLQDFRTDDVLSINWTVEEIEKYRIQLRQRVKYGSYNNKDIYLVLDKYTSLAVSNKTCAVIGTGNPWIEAALIEYNASMITTIEYATIHSKVPRLKTITHAEFARKQQNETYDREFFDSVWSYSSLEHDGLGRYRDPLNAYGDFQTMIKITCLLKPGGFLFLSVPLNIKDHLQFNLHRLYGPIRLPLLYRYFHIVEVLGTDLGKDIYNYEVQPFVVLQNKVGCKNS
ncbi:hypothetical protein I4U23_028633 [Adineta vaga]|nr:hypothetical protein I4U23_028633 [Adineta vaga]